MVRSKTILANRYWLDQPVMPHLAPEAWRARDLATGRTVTVWRPRVSSAARTERLLSAAEHITRIRHPGIARILDSGLARPDGTPFVVTELVGAPLAAVMQAGPLDPAWILDIVRQVTSAMSVTQGAGVQLAIDPWSLRLTPGGTVKVVGFDVRQEADRLAGGHGDSLRCLGLVAWGCLTGQLSSKDAWQEEATGRRQGGEATQLPPLPATVPAGIATLTADLATAGPATPLPSAAEVQARCGELLAAPLRAVRPSTAGGPGRTSLLDAPAACASRPAPEGSAAATGRRVPPF